MSHILCNQYTDYRVILHWSSWFGWFHGIFAKICDSNFLFHTVLFFAMSIEILNWAEWIHSLMTLPISTYIVFYTGLPTTIQYLYNLCNVQNWFVWTSHCVKLPIFLNFPKIDQKVGNTDIQVCYFSPLGREVCPW